MESLHNHQPSIEDSKPPVNAIESYDSCRYLTSKITVDDRSLNRRLWDAFLHGLVEIQNDTQRLRILEVAGGIGTTVKRLAAALRRTSIETIDYTFVEIDTNHLERARAKLPEWGRELGYEVHETENEVRFSDAHSVLTVELVEENAFSVFEKATYHNRFNAVIAQAWIDIVNAQKALTGLTRVLQAKDGLLYLPIHFDGVTSFLPALDDDLDRRIERLYHHSMAQSPDGPVGGSTTGRKLLASLSEMNDVEVTAGSSDWIVVPNDDHTYPADERYFLHHILHFVENELKRAETIDPRQANHWLVKRRGQIEDGQLIYMAHQLDVLAQTQ